MNITTLKKASSNWNFGKLKVMMKLVNNALEKTGFTDEVAK
jgi:hypothetical protein